MNIYKFTILTLVVLLNVNRNAGQFIPIFSWVRSFFGYYEEAPYLSLRNITDDIEERSYPSKNWACTEEFSDPETKDSKMSGMFMNLFRYIQGRNEGETKIEMTIPVATKVDHRNGNLRSYEMCFFIPQEFQDAPPKSTNRKIRIIKFPELRLYSKRYSGYSSGTVEKEQFSELSSQLKNMSIPYFEEVQGDRATYFYAGYDSPTKFWNRRNEIWLLAADTDKNINNLVTAYVSDEEVANAETLN